MSLPVIEARERVLDILQQSSRYLSSQEYAELLDELICDLEARKEAPEDET